MKYWEEAEMSPIPRTSDLEQSVEDQYWLGVLTFLEQVLTQVIERVGKKSTSLAQGTLTEFIFALETNSEIESDQPPLTPDMSPIIRPEVQSIEISIPHFPLSETKLSVVLDKTQEIIFELLMNSMEIYLAQEKVFQDKEKFVSSSERKYWKGFKGNKLRAPYKDQRSEESLFYKETMAKVKKTAKRAEKQSKPRKSEQPGEGRTK